VQAVKRFTGGLTFGTLTAGAAGYLTGRGLLAVGLGFIGACVWWFGWQVASLIADTLEDL
jgi:hypothetical protein